MRQDLEQELLARYTRREIVEWRHGFRVLIEKLARQVETKREANKLVELIRQELRLKVRIKQRRAEAERKKATGGEQ